MSKKVGVISTSRADYSIYYPLLKSIHLDPAFDLTVVALGMHCSPLYGRTVETIRNDGFKVIECPDSLIFGTDKLALSKGMGLTMSLMADVLKDNSFDLMICLGDRFEMYAAVSSVIPFCIPIAHLHGGELTEGAIDQKFRNAISKLADYHLVSCEKHKERVLQMGVSEERVLNVGSLGIEGLLSEKILSIDEIKNKYHIDLSKFTMLCTYHPVSIHPERAECYITELLKAFDQVDSQVVITRTNADTSGDLIYARMLEFQHRNPDRIFIVENLGRIGYASFMNYSGMMIGNSSSGIIEAASFNLPVVNIGDRQKGRETSENVVHCKEGAEFILEAIGKASALRGKKFQNIYFSDRPSEAIRNYIKKELVLDYSFIDRKCVL